MEQYLGHRTLQRCCRRTGTCHLGPDMLMDPLPSALVTCQEFPWRRVAKMGRNRCPRAVDLSVLCAQVPFHRTQERVYLCLRPGVSYPGPQTDGFCPSHPPTYSPLLLCFVVSIASIYFKPCTTLTSSLVMNMFSYIQSTCKDLEKGGGCEGSCD